MSILVAILALGALVIVHESGHFFVARWCKMRVERFSIGFGPPILKWMRKGTQFQLGPIPFGGFVQISGMNPHEDVDPKDPAIFTNRPTYQRFLTILAGPAMNYVFAMFLVFAIFMIAGMDSGRSYVRVAAVSDGMPAAGKLEPGDRILAVNGKDIRWRHDLDEGTTPQGHVDFKNPIQEAAGKPVVLTVERDGRRQDIEITARLEKVGDTDRKEWLVGITPDPEPIRERASIGRAVVESVSHPVELSKTILVGLYKVIKREEKGEFTGPVGITHVMKRQVELGWVRFFEVLAMLNVYLGLFNLLPLPALDGGRLAFLGYELATRRRPNPKIEAAVHMVGIVALLMLMLLVTFKDIRRLFT